MNNKKEDDSQPVVTTKENAELTPQMEDLAKSALKLRAFFKLQRANLQKHYNDFVASERAQGLALWAKSNLKWPFSSKEAKEAKEHQKTPAAESKNEGDSSALPTSTSLDK